jgi:hypothetical protein
MLLLYAQPTTFRNSLPFTAQASSLMTTKPVTARPKTPTPLARGSEVKLTKALTVYVRRDHANQPIFDNKQLRRPSDLGKSYQIPEGTIMTIASDPENVATTVR